MRRRRTWNERYTAEGVIMFVIFLAGIAATIGFALSLEDPYPCSGRHNCSAEVVR